MMSSQHIPGAMRAPATILLIRGLLSSNRARPEDYVRFAGVPRQPSDRTSAPGEDGLLEIVDSGVGLPSISDPRNCQQNGHVGGCVDQVAARSATARPGVRFGDGDERGESGDTTRADRSAELGNLCGIWHGSAPAPATRRSA